MRSFNLIIISLLTSGAFLISCGRSGKGESSSAPEIARTDSLPVDVSDIVKAVSSDDSVSFSSHVAYPLERPYPLKDIQDEEEMKAYYPVLVDDSLRKVISNSGNKDWNEEGWRGWTVKDGQYLWIDGTVYEVNYVSSRERTLKDSLIKREKESLPSHLRSGWVPEWVMEDIAEGTVYRIDADSVASEAIRKGSLTEGEYRLLVYNNGGDLRRNPDKVLRGKRKVEGTVGTVSYLFDTNSAKAMADSSEYVIELFSDVSGGPRLYHRMKRKDLKRRKITTPKSSSENIPDTLIDHELKKVYWLDKVKEQPKDSIKTKEAVKVKDSSKTKVNDPHRKDSLK
ncbi:MAG: hypothetical protein HDS62_09335 [Bacteroidales bacterium]|nr:hypothetical protein [Bacteroidales bacterium]